MEKRGKAYSNRHSNLNRPYCSGSWAKTPASSSAHLQSQASGPIWPEGSVDSSVIWVSSQRAILPTHPGRKTNSQPNPTAKHSLKSCSSRKPGQRTQIARKPILQPCLGEEPSQMACPTVEHRPWHHITREPDQWLWTALEPNPWYNQARSRPVTAPGTEPS